MSLPLLLRAANRHRSRLAFAVTATAASGVRSRLLGVGVLHSSSLKPKPFNTMAAAAAASAVKAAAPAVGADGRKVVDVKLTLDVACPWCFIGQRRLYKAIGSHLDSKQFDVKVSILPFLLAPDAPTPGIDRADRIKAKYGIDDAKLQANHAGLVAKGLEQAGIKFGGVSGGLGNTINSLRLITWATAKFGADKAHALLDAIEIETFEKNKDPSLTPVLLEAVKVAGIDEKAAAAFLASDELVEQTKKDAADAKTRGVKTVPNIYVNGVYAEDGSQSDFQAVFKKAGLIA